MSTPHPNPAAAGVLPGALFARYPHLQQGLKPYLVAGPLALPHLDLAPFGWPVEWVIDPLRMAAQGWLSRLQTLDGLTFGPRGLHMPQWILFDGAAMTGGMFGLALATQTLTPEERRVLRVAAGAPEWIPVSVYAAIPTHQPGEWMGHNLASLGSLLPNRALDGLGLMTKTLALKCFGATIQLGVTQWSAGALYIHTRFGPLEMLSAYTPAHTRHDSLTYRWAVSDPRLLAAVSQKRAPLAPDGPHPTQWVSVEDTGAMKSLQARLEQGARAWILGPPQIPPQIPPQAPPQALPDAPVLPGGGAGGILSEVRAVPVRVEE